MNSSSIINFKPLWLKRSFCAAILMCVMAASLLCMPLSFSQNISLEQITVRKPQGATADSFEAYSALDLERLPLKSPEEAVDYSPSVDLKKRSSFGIQQDVSLRGSVFEDTDIAIGDVVVNDPQTGHFNLELPFTSADLEGVDIYKNGQKINFVPKKPSDKGFLLKNSFGQHALWENLLSYNFPIFSIKNRISAEHKVAQGSRHDTDFDIYNFSFHSLWEADTLKSELLFGQTKRDFGADSFYSSRFNQEEEHINQRFLSFKIGKELEAFTLNNTFYLRRHRDKFILNRNDPSFYTNYHTTYIYGLQNQFDFYNDFFAGLNLERETIDSTNLSKHYRLKKGFFLGLKDKEIAKFILNIRAGLDYYSGWQYLESGHFGLSYPLRDNLNLKFSYDRLWRLPSFTELYYSDPANMGNSNLGAQRSHNYEWGFDFSPIKALNVSAAFFLRNQSKTIDWGKNTPVDVWQADNVTDLKVHGADFLAGYKFSKSALDSISFGYTYLNLNKSGPQSLSKYVFDYNRHALLSNIGFDARGLKINFITHLSKPVNRSEYATVDLKLEKQIRNFTFSLEGTNIFNKSYQELQDIDADSRWYKMSVAYSF
ncbi:MAG: TonB-dependent receptor [Candidatus Omnitrophica bacterium]|nr:TonB-dependent receptor [Candidatus Omnitrophota bacterium]